LAVTLTQVQLGTRLARTRQDAGLSHADLAHQLGTTPELIEEMEKGQRPVFSFEIARIARAVDKSPTWFLALDQSTLERNLRAVAAGRDDEVGLHVAWLADFVRDDRLLRQLVADVS
jgi:transcriptional regulator with XRE-family HTH domain